MKKTVVYILFYLTFLIISVEAQGFSRGFESDDCKIDFYYSQIERALVFDNKDAVSNLVTIDIYNITGNHVFSIDMEIFSGKNNLLQVDLKSGLYILIIKEDNKAYTRKFVVK